MWVASCGWTARCWNMEVEESGVGVLLFIIPPSFLFFFLLFPAGLFLSDGEVGRFHPRRRIKGYWNLVEGHCVVDSGSALVLAVKPTLPILFSSLPFQAPFCIGTCGVGYGMWASSQLAYVGSSLRSRGGLLRVVLPFSD